MERTEYTMMEVISKIKFINKKMDEMYKRYISEESSSRAMISLYNPDSRITINGVPADNVIDSIENIHSEIMSMINDVNLFNTIKEQVNAIKTITFTNIEGIKQTLTVTQFLAITSPKVKKYHMDYLNKLKKDAEDAQHALGVYTQKVMSDDKVSMYVNSKMNSLHINNDPDRATYYRFASEYRNANRMEILDPLHIQNGIDEKIKEVEEWYDKASVKLSIFNATTKVWVEKNDDTVAINWGIV